MWIEPSLPRAVELPSVFVLMAEPTGEWPAEGPPHGDHHRPGAAKSG
jgi:hypothetical protein